VDTGAVLEACRYGLAQRPERERAKLHQRQHHPLPPRRPRCCSATLFLPGRAVVLYCVGAGAMRAAEVAAHRVSFFLEKKDMDGIDSSQVQAYWPRRSVLALILFENLLIGVLLRS
jgi:hypothetical protein